MKKIVLPFLCVIIFISAVKTVFAAEIKNDIFIKENIVEASEIINGDGMFIADEIENIGDITGDLLSVSLYQTSNHALIQGNIRSLAGSFYNYGVVEKNLMVVAGEINLCENSHVNGNAYLLANVVNINAEIKKDAYIYGSNININAKIDGRLIINSGSSSNINIKNIENVNGLIIHKGMAPIKSLEDSENYTFIKIDTNKINLNNLINIGLEAIIILIVGMLFFLALSKRNVVHQKINYKKLVIIGLLSLLLILCLIASLLLLIAISAFFKIPVLTLILLAVIGCIIMIIIISNCYGMFLVGRLCQIKKHNILAFIVGGIIYYFIIAVLLVLANTFQGLVLTSNILSISFRIIVLFIGTGSIVNNLKS